MFMNPVEQLVGATVARLQLAGLLTAFYDPHATSPSAVDEAAPQADLPALLSLYQSLAKTLDLLEEANALVGAHLALSKDLPFLYNTQTFTPGDPWASRGHSDGSFSLRKVLSGYASLWILQLNGSPTAVNRVLKATVWIMEQHGSVREGLDYLFVLNRAGFLIKSSTLYGVLAGLTRLYARPSDLKLISQLSFSETDQETADFLVDGLDGKTASEIGLYLLDAVICAIKRCKEAMEPTEWTAARAELANLVEALFSFEREFRCMQHWSLQHRFQYTSLEEIACDLCGAMRGHDCDELEQRFNLDAGWGMTSGLIKLLAGEGWPAVRQVLGARVLLPDCLLPVVEQMFSRAPSETPLDFDSSLPDVWRHHSELVGHTLATLRGIQPQYLRWDPSGSPAEYSGVAVPMTIAVSDASQLSELSAGSAAISDEEKLDILRTHSRELAEAVQTYINVQDQGTESRIPVIDFILKKYPLSPAFMLERAILRDEAGSPDLAVEDILKSLTLNPNDPLAWQSFGVICRRLGYPMDGAIADLINRVLEEVPHDAGVESEQAS